MLSPPRVFVTQAIDPEGLALLADFDVRVRKGPRPISLLDLQEGTRGCAALIAMPTDRINEEVLAVPGLRIVANHAVGTDNIDLNAARERGVVVTNTPGVLTDATADLTLALLLALARHLPASERFLRDQRFTGWHPLEHRGLELRGARLGIIGRGRIGDAVARRAEAFGMLVVHHNRSSGIPLDQLLETSDIVSLHCPLSSLTHHLIDAERLARMKPGALLINTARGPVVDEAALVDALRTGHLGGAALDVFEREPAVHPALLHLPNVLLTPHIGSATHQARRQMAVMAARNVASVLQGDGPLNPVTGVQA